MPEQIIMAGFGGQGIMTMGQVLTYGGMIEGKNVSWLPSYGPEMRGGTANCSVIVSSKPVGSPVVTEATNVLALNALSADKFKKLLLPKGFMFINSSIVKNEIDRKDIFVYKIPAGDVAEKLGNSKVVNMVMLGAFIERTGIVKFKTIIEALNKVLDKSKQHLITVNVKALMEGSKLVKQGI